MQSIWTAYFKYAVHLDMYHYYEISSTRSIVLEFKRLQNMRLMPKIALKDGSTSLMTGVRANDDDIQVDSI